MPHFIRCANAYATLGEQCAVLREVFGEYREPVGASDVHVRDRSSSRRSATVAAFEALGELSDEGLERPVDGAHGWSGRDLMGHLAWQEVAVAVAPELAVGETSATKDRRDAEWDARRRRVKPSAAALGRASPGRRPRAVRHERPANSGATLTVVPEARWLKHPTNMDFLARRSSTTRSTRPTRRHPRGRTRVNLRDLFEDASRACTGHRVTTASDGSTTWSRGGRPFATVSVDGSVAEFALDKAVADAAIRTPDTEPSARGAGWVAFRPAELDDHAMDRAEAWFLSGHRRLQPQLARESNDPGRRPGSLSRAGLRRGYSVVVALSTAATGAASGSTA